ncbi:MAG: rod shape-determining protein [Clostridia bacterium]|nr:rod shape-determining protein [Clostridia bacterium]
MAIDIAVDLGTSKTILYSGSKVVLEQPSVATVDTDTWEPLYFGDDAYKMIGRIPETLSTVFPLSRGAISDYNITEAMLTHYMRMAFGQRIIKPRVIISVPTGLTTVQHRSIANAVEAAGGRNTCIIESPVASAIELGAQFEQARGCMVIDIGAGITDIAVLSMGGLVEHISENTASNDFDDAIMKYVQRERHILIGLQTARNIKTQIGSALHRNVEVAATAKGQNLFSGLPHTFEITTNEVHNALKPCLDAICRAVRKVTEKTPPDVLADVMADGIHLTGGGSLLYGMDTLLSEFTGIPVKRAENPGQTAVRGAGKALKNPKLIQNGDYLFRSIQELIIE